MLKTIHVICAYTTGIGFLLRGILILMQSPLSNHRVTKTAPHIIDTILLLSGVLMVYQWSISPTTQPWLLAKLTALMLYIACGLVMIRFGTTENRQWIGLLGGLLIYIYIIGVAHSKSVLSIFSLF